MRLQAEYSQFLLIELAAARPSRRRELQAYLAEDSTAWLFDGTPEEEIRDHGPLLIHISSISEQAVRDVINKWQEDFPAYSVRIESDSSLIDLAITLRPWLEIKLPDGEIRLFRFYHGPVFSQLSEISSPTEHARLFHGIEAFFWRNEFDCEWNCTRPRHKQSFHGVDWLFSPSDEQWRLLSEESDLRAVRANLLTENVGPDWWQSMSRAQRYEVFEKHLRSILLASRLIGMDDLLTFVKLQLNFPNSDLLAIDDLAPALAQACKQLETFEKALLNLPSDCLAKLERNENYI